MNKYYVKSRLLLLHRQLIHSKIRQKLPKSQVPGHGNSVQNIKYVSAFETLLLLGKRLLIKP